MKEASKEVEFFQKREEKLIHEKREFFREFFFSLKIFKLFLVKIFFPTTFLILFPTF